MIFGPKETTKTFYGFKKTGKSPFIIVAPHGAGDDLKSPIIAKKIAKKIDAFLIVNKKYIKPNNSKAKRGSETILDFNRLCWSRKNKKYLWKRRPVLKNFFNDIGEFADLAKKYSQEDKAIVIYIHSAKNKEVGIDLGFGIKSVRNKNRFIFSDKTPDKNSGVATIKIKQIKKLKKELEEPLYQYNQTSTTIGQIHSGWSKSSAIQFHKHGGRNEYAFQVEIGKSFRQDKKSIDFISSIISESIIKTFI